MCCEGIAVTCRQVSCSWQERICPCEIDQHSLGVGAQLNFHRHVCLWQSIPAEQRQLAPVATLEMHPGQLQPLVSGPSQPNLSSELGWPTPLSVPLSPAAGWGVPGRQPLLPRPASATPGHPPPFSAGWGVSGSQPLSPRPASATPGHSPPLQLAGVSLAARPSHLGQLVPLLGILLLQCRHPCSSPSFNSRNACVQ